MSPNSFLSTTELTRAPCPSRDGWWAMVQGTLSILQMSTDIQYKRGGRTVRERLAQLQYQCDFMTVRPIGENVCMRYLQTSTLFHFEQTCLRFILAIELIDFQSKGGPSVWMLFKALEDQDLFLSHTTKFFCNPLLSQRKTVQITAYTAILL